MNDEMLKYYNRELTFIRRMGAEFADQYPKIAGRLKISDENVEDPHVSRLIESFSFLTAQIRQKLDDSFPELTDALLGQLYPDYQAPIPSMAVVKMTTKNLTDNGIEFPRDSEIKTHEKNANNCTFKTCYSTELLPVEVTSAEFRNAPFNAPKPQTKKPIKSVIKLSLACEQDNVEWHEMKVDRLRFYINGQRHHVYSLYELIFMHTLTIGIAPTGEPEKIRYLPLRHLQHVGFDDEHQVVPYSQRSLPGYRLLIEQFLFPEKFLFFDLNELNPDWVGIKDKLDIYFYLSEDSDELERHVTKESFQLGCTPVINLFKQNMEPVRFDESHYEYRLAPQYENAENCELVKIETVNAFDEHGESITLNPFYAQGHPRYEDQDSLFWHARRESSDWVGGSHEAGTEMYLSVVDKQFKGVNAESQNKDWILYVEAECSNRNQPSLLPFGGGAPKMGVEENFDSVKEVRCLTAPTQSIRPALHESTRWQLVSHLNLNHFTGEDALARLKDTLKLYDFRQTSESRMLIDGICKLSISAGTARVNLQGRVAICSGSNIAIEFTQASYAGSGIYFFSNILNVFFAQYAAINSFTRLSIKLKGHENIYHRWPARVGTRVLL